MTLPFTGGALRRRGCLAAAALALLGTLAPAAQAQDDFPSRNLTLIVPYPAGGANDAVGRLIGQKMAEVLGQAVVVDNRPGAGTAIGTAMAARAPSDGYTLVLGSLASHAVTPNLLGYKVAGYDPVADFAPLGLIGKAPIIATVGTDSRYTSLAAVVEQARKTPGQVMYGSAGNGSPLHLAGALFGRAAGVEMTHVPYKGGNAHTLDLIAGRLDVIFDTSTSALPLTRGGKARALAVAAPTRLAELPDVPTFAEAGYKNFQVDAWYALYTRAKTPAPVLRKLGDALAKVMQMPDVNERLQQFAITPAHGSAEQLAVFTRQELDKYGTVIREMNIRPD
ncbi:MAG: hypothetical protein GAK30_00122 [Paracidovorax wautersii]|uniref:Tripartite-type tricarboxylate transporter, receptor component TctC n=1 Tax=Paracidovorax wautersii TaxID=1177982 RepID=A0A7V8FSL0_9BURK|nr:MAG: hypothetical protein GAK30_00122 [Paracidovorax wautersii]